MRILTATKENTKMSDWKLIKIDHTRCGSYEATTYAWAKNEVDEPELRKLVDDAIQMYLDAERVALAAAPPYVCGPQYDKYPEKFVFEVRAEFNAAKSLRDEWELAQRKAKKSFIFYLIETGKGLIKEFYGEGVALDVKAIWGHNHGVRVDYSDNCPSSHDFIPSGPKDEDDENYL
jgi:hypothetical protein